MLVIDGQSKFDSGRKTYIALGSFDGLHTGHRRLIEKTKALAGMNDAESMVYTFKNHPLSIINKDVSPKLLMDNGTKLEILEECGIDIACMVQFNEEIMRMSPCQFITHILKCYNMKGVIVGFNYRFGYKNEGDIHLLRKLGEELNFEVHIVEALKLDGEVVSSTRIRRLILEGDLKRANRMLLCPFLLKGRVIGGRKLGRTLGFPTANIELDSQFICPKVGVYYTNTVVRSTLYRSITNVGYNPTVQGAGLTIESHILDFNDEIYGREIGIYFIERMRDEIKFCSVDELKEQLSLDKEYAEKQKIVLFE